MKALSDYRAMARESLNGHWNSWALAYLLIILVACVFSGGSAAFPHIATLLSGVSGVISILVIVPLEYGLYVAMVDHIRRPDDEELGTPLDGMWANFKAHYEKFVICGVLVALIAIAGVFTLFVVTILAAFWYALVPFIIRDYPELSVRDTLYTSRMMMRGHKMELFCLYLTFIGWFLLCILTCGIGLLWLEPYMCAATIHFYEDVKAEYETQPVE